MTNPIDYNPTLDKLLTYDGVVVLDNVIPNTIDAFDQNNRIRDARFTRRLELLLSNCLSFEEKLRAHTGRIIILRAIYAQIIKGSNLIKDITNIESEKNLYDNPQRELIKKCLKYNLDILTLISRNCYRKENYPRYKEIVAALESLDKEHKLRKPNHSQDGFADGKIVAAAFLEAEERKKVSIITADRDIDRLARAYVSFNKPKYGSVTIYRNENGTITSSLL